MNLPEVTFTHLLRLSDDTGILEHAFHAVPRREHGYTTDDVARGLLVISRAPDPPVAVAELGWQLIAFLRAAAAPGNVRNRLGYDRRWQRAEPPSDAHGRALWGLGSAARSNRDPALRAAAEEMFLSYPAFQSSHLSALAYAVLGTAEMARARPDHPGLYRRLERWAESLPRPSRSSWRWPARRLGYDNARLPEALIRSGWVLERPDLVNAGIDLLDWLVETETRGDHFSFVPAGGWAPGEPRPGFDQQPLEAWAMADAAVAALEAGYDPAWLAVVERAAAWFLGRNDVGCWLYDADTGGGYDGLTPGGPNLNQGAESTLAGLATLLRAEQHTGWLSPGSEMRDATRLSHR